MTAARKVEEPPCRENRLGASLLCAVTFLALHVVCHVRWSLHRNLRRLSHAARDLAARLVLPGWSAQRPAPTPAPPRADLLTPPSRCY